MNVLRCGSTYPLQRCIFFFWKIRNGNLIVISDNEFEMRGK